VKEPIIDIIQSCDSAFQAKTSADYTVILTAGKSKGGHVFVMDMFRERVEWPELLTNAERLYRHWNPSRVLIENKASGQSLIQDLKRKGIPVLSVNPDGDKYRRASAVTGMVESGMVHLPYGEEWVNDLIEELADFPESPHDDIVDAFSMAMSYFKRGALSVGGGSVIGGEPKPEARDTRDLGIQRTEPINKYGDRRRSVWR